MREVRFSHPTRGGRGRRVRGWAFAGFRGVICEIQSRISYSTSCRLAVADSALSQLSRATRTFATRHRRDAEERLLRANIATAWFDVSRFHRVESRVPERKRRGKGARGKRTPSGTFWFPIRSEARTSVTAAGVEKVKEKANKREGHHEIGYEGAKRAVAVSRSARIDRGQLARDAAGNEGVQFHSKLRRFRFIISRPLDDRRRHGAINRTTIHDAQPSDRSDRSVTEIISL